jgi:NADPH-dependent 7-cyano-7-deazaguanine reductase QueF
MIDVVKAESVDLVRIEAKLEAICPITGTVDHYELALTYIPNNGNYLELLSFKRFLESFKGVKILHEDLAHRIAREVCKAALPRKVVIELRSIFMEMKVTIVKEHGCEDLNSS